jgi:thiol:disulfide interchange protein DsbC
MTLKKLKFILTLINIVFAGTITLAYAGVSEDIAVIKSKLSSRTPPLVAKSITPSPIDGLYEVFVQGDLIYTDKSFSYVIVNAKMMDVATEKNLTAERIKQITTIRFDELPLRNAIEIKKGSGAYKFAVFSDPECPYCKSLELELTKAGAMNYTAYIFLLPLTDLHPDAAKKSEAIWCAKDKAEAWTNFILKGTAPEKATCESPLSANEKLAQEIGVFGTPTIFLNDGQQTQDPEILLSAIKKNK